jgi:hypothetical protein
MMGISAAMTVDQQPRRDRGDLGGVYSASREGKRLNMLGFNNLLDNNNVRDNQTT